MSTSTQTLTPLRQRMLDDLRMRRLSEATQRGYIRAVKRLAAFLGRSAGHRHGRRPAAFPIIFG